MNYSKSFLGKLSRFFLASCLGLGVFMLLPLEFTLAQSIPPRWETNAYQPPRGIGTPSGTEPGGTRAPKGDKLISLLPNNGFGVTAAAYPTFLIYIPKSSGNNDYYAEFLLEDDQGITIYRSNFKMMVSDQIISISLPSNLGLTPLEIDKNYRWSFRLYNDSLRLNEDGNTNGWIRRISVPWETATQISMAAPQVQARLYAQSEIWYDAVATLAQIYRDNPNDLAVATDWNTLLKSAGLEQLIETPLFSAAK